MGQVTYEGELERRVQEAAKKVGASPEEFARDALRQRCDEVLGVRLSKALADMMESRRKEREKPQERSDGGQHRK